MNQSISNIVCVLGFLVHLYRSHCEFQGDFQRCQSFPEVITASTTEELAEMLFLGGDTNQ